jgi:DNA-binding GntR family transcriptional regulator
MTSQIDGKKPKTGRKRSAEEPCTSLDAAFQQIRELTVYGVLSPGSWIAESEADRKAGNEPHSCARGPAVAPTRLLRRLEQRISSKSRMIVAPLSKEDASELYSIMGHLEGFAGRRLLCRRTSGINLSLQCAPPTQSCIGLRARKLDGESIFDLDTEFHRVIAEASAGPRLSLMHSGIKPQMERYWPLYANNIIAQREGSRSDHQRNSERRRRRH